MKEEVGPADGFDPPPVGGGPRGRARGFIGGALAAAVLLAVVEAATQTVSEGVLERLFSSDPPPCPQERCDNVNPEKTECPKDASRWQGTGPNPATLELRYSPHCSVVWGRVLAGAPGDVVSVQVEDGGTRRAKINYGDDQFTDTAAVGESFGVRVCLDPVASRGEQPEGEQPADDRDAYCIETTRKDFTA